MLARLLAVALMILVPVRAALAAEAAPGSVPVIHITDLYHPHNDPDDHFDLATVFGMPAFDIRAVVIDTGKDGAGRPGVPAIQQMMHITGKKVPFATGLVENLKSQADTCAQQLPETQAGVELILKVLRESDKPVTVFCVGSLRDMAAAYNREPELVKAKLGRCYVNAGDTAGGMEWNVSLDPHAYVRIMDSALPIYWMPCFGADGYQSYWYFRQVEVLESAPLAFQNFIVYALSKTPLSERDPIAALTDPIDAKVRENIWNALRNMWCTAGYLHAAGVEDGTFSFRMVPVHLDNNGTSRVTNGAEGLQITTLHVEDSAAYTASMTKALRGICGKLGTGN
jgi:hypothetical protein